MLFEGISVRDLRVFSLMKKHILFYKINILICWVAIAIHYFLPICDTLSHKYHIFIGCSEGLRNTSNYLYLNQNLSRNICCIFFNNFSQEEHT